MLDELRRDADRTEGAQWTVGVDGGVVRAHQHAAGARHQAPADVPVEVVAPVELGTGGRVESQEISADDTEDATLLAGSRFGLVGMELHAGRSLAGDAFEVDDHAFRAGLSAEAMST